MRRRNLPARGTVKLSRSRWACCRSNRPNSHCIVPLQIAQVQVSTEVLEVSGMDSKDSSPKTVLPLVCLRNLPPLPPSSSAACGHCGDGLSVNFNFFKLNAFKIYISKVALEMIFASHRHHKACPKSCIKTKL